MASSGILVFASGLIVIVSASGSFAPSTGAEKGCGDKGDNDHGHSTSRQRRAAASTGARYR